MSQWGRIVFAGIALIVAGCAGDTDAMEIGSDRLPTERVGVGPLAVTEPTPAQDPVLQFPSELVWRESWFPIENPVRDRSPSTQSVLDLVGARPGMHIADVGAGGGYFSFQWAHAVGPEGHVYAIDVDPRMSRKLAWERSARGVTNVTPLRVIEGALGLEPAAVDVVAMIDIGAFKRCTPRLNQNYIDAAALALRPGGRLVVMNNLDLGSARDSAECAPLDADEMIALASRRFDLASRADVSMGEWRAYAVALALRP